MESIAAYVDEEGSSPSVNEDGGSDHEASQDMEISDGKGNDGIDAVDDNAEDGYREENFGQAESDDDGDKNKENEDDSKDLSSQPLENPRESQEEGELSMSSDTAPKEVSYKEVSGGDKETSNANEENQSDQNGLEDEEDDGEPRVLPQEVTTPFSLASFLTNMAPQIDEDQPSEKKDERNTEYAYVNGTYARVARNRVDIDELDRRLDNLREQRREEIGLLRMYGLDDREDRGEGRGGEGRGGGRDRGDRDNDGGRRQRSRSRSRDRDRGGDRRRSRSKERRRSRSRERALGSRSKDRSSRRDRDSPERSRGKEDKERYGRDKDRFGGRDRDDKGRDRDDKGRDRDDKGRDRDRFGREKDRFGRDRPEPSRERDREDRDPGRSKSPRNDRRDNNSRDRPFTGRGQEGNNQRNDPPKYSDKGGSEGGLFSRKRDSSFGASQDFYPSQQQPLPVPPPDSFSHVPPPDSFNQFQSSGAFNQPPPPLDPYSTSVPPPQPWMGAPPNFQQPPPSQPPPHLLGAAGNYSQPPPSLPPPPSVGNVNPANGDLNTLKQSLSMMTGALDPMGGGGGGSQGYRGVPDPSQPPPSSWGMETGGGYSDSGPLDDDPMDLDMPAADDYQVRVVDEVKNAIRPFFNNGDISKDQYKEILKKSVPKVLISGEINPKKISNLVGAYVKKMKGSRAK